MPCRRLVGSCTSMSSGNSLMGMNKRTYAALGGELMEQLKRLQFCIVGCGGTGANFAEMLVRSGARRLVLIDGGAVKTSDLNRVFGFTAQDVGKPKVKALAERLKSIARDEVDVCALGDSFRRPDQILDDNTLGQRVRDAVHDADVVFAATDPNSSSLVSSSYAVTRTAECFSAAACVWTEKPGSTDSSVRGPP